MRVNLKGLHSTKKKLADGSIKTYWYAWKNGPALPGVPGDNEFMAAYNAAVAEKSRPAKGALQSILNAFQASSEWDNLADRTRRDYVGLIKVIEKRFGDMPLAVLTRREARGVFMAWRDERAKASRRQGDYGWQVLARILSWAYGRGLVGANPCEKGGRVYRGTRADKIWTDADERAFLGMAPAHLHLPLLLALWTGQRQGDLLALTWMQYDGAHIRLRQGKTGRRVTIKCGEPLRIALDAQRKKAGQVLLTSEGDPWTSDGFRSSWRKACIAAGIKGVTFNDTRGTAVSRLALVGCTVPQIVAITGHSLRDAGAILDAHYLNRDQQLGDDAITKLETRTKSPNQPTN